MHIFVYTLAGHSLFCKIIYVETFCLIVGMHYLSPQRSYFDHERYTQGYGIDQTHATILSYFFYSVTEKSYE